MNTKGSITLDYLFTFFLVTGLTLVIMTFSATLSMVEVVQYAAYAAGRNFMSSHLNIDKQREAAARKFKSLTSNPTLAPLLNGGWYKIPDGSFIADYNIGQKYPAFSDYAFQGSEGTSLFHGVIVGFQAKILDFQIPFFGGTKKMDGSTSDDTAFTTNITAFVGREPTFEECADFNDQRWKKIKELANGTYTKANDDASYAIINDNGC